MAGLVQEDYRQTWQGWCSTTVRHIRVGTELPPDMAGLLQYYRQTWQGWYSTTARHGRVGIVLTPDMAGVVQYYRQGWYKGTNVSDPRGRPLSLESYLCTFCPSVSASRLV